MSKATDFADALKNRPIFDMKDQRQSTAEVSDNGSLILPMAIIPMDTALDFAEWIIDVFKEKE